MDKNKMQEFNQIKSRDATELKAVLMMERPEVKETANEILDLVIKADLSYIETKKAMDYANQLLLNKLLNYRKLNKLV